VDTDDLAFYLLDLVSEFAQPLSIFAWDQSRRGYYLNKQNPPSSPQELVAALLELQASGDIRFLWRRSNSKPWRTGGAVRDVGAEEVEAGILEAVPLSYEVTPQGGERWARICNVDWRSWPDYCGRPYERSVDTITTGDPEWTAFWLEVECRWGYVDRDSVTWQEVRPWRPVHWHEEPVGYRVSYPAVESHERKADMPASPCSPTHRPTAPLAPRRVRTLPATARPLQKWSDTQLEKRARKAKGRREFAVVMEQARRQEDLVKLRLWLDWGQPRRHAAARELGRRRDADAVEALVEAVFSHGDLTAVEALAAIGDERCLAPLTTLFAHLGGRSSKLIDTIGGTIASFGEAGVTALLPLAWKDGRGLQALRHTRSERAVEAVRARVHSNWQARSVLESMGVLSTWPWPSEKLSADRLAGLRAIAAKSDWRSRYELASFLRQWRRVDLRGAEDLLAQLREDPDIVVRGEARLV